MSFVAKGESLCILRAQFLSGVSSQGCYLDFEQDSFFIVQFYPHACNSGPHLLNINRDPSHGNNWKKGLTPFQMPSAETPQLQIT